MNKLTNWIKTHQVAAFFANASNPLEKLVPVLCGFLMSSGINEESGWRGFALPRLQARYPVLVAAGIVWFFWAWTAT